MEKKEKRYEKIVRYKKSDDDNGRDLIWVGIAMMTFPISLPIVGLILLIEGIRYQIQGGDKIEEYREIKEV